MCGLVGVRGECGVILKDYLTAALQRDREKTVYFVSLKSVCFILCRVF